MTRDRAAALSVVAAALFAANAARSVECPEILNFGQLVFEQHFDTDAPPSKPFGAQTYFPIVAIHEVAQASPLPIDIQDFAWCHDLGADAVSLDTSVSSPGVAAGVANAAVAPDGSLAAYASGTVEEVLPLTSSAGGSLVQIGFRDVIQVGGSGTDPVELTLHRSIDGDWTSQEPHGDTLYVEGTRTFTLTIHEFPTPDVLSGVVRRLVVDDNETVGFLNAENDYVFDAIPGHTLVLTLYLEAGVQCNAGLSFEQHQYLGCFGFENFSGDPFGGPVHLSLSAPPGVPLTAESGIDYAPEADVVADCEVASLAIAVIAITRRRNG